MDVLVTPTAESKTWQLTDLLGRSMGAIVENSPKAFAIHPSGPAVATLVGIPCAGYATLDDALAQIERHTRGQCRRNY